MSTSIKKLKELRVRCQGMVVMLLRGGILCRNAITLDGSIADNFIGTGGLIVTSAGTIIP